MPGLGLGTGHRGMNVGDIVPSPGGPRKQPADYNAGDRSKLRQPHELLEEEHARQRKQQVQRP